MPMKNQFVRFRQQAPDTIWIGKRLAAANNTVSFTLKPDGTQKWKLLYLTCHWNGTAQSGSAHSMMIRAIGKGVTSGENEMFYYATDSTRGNGIDINSNQAFILSDENYFQVDVSNTSGGVGVDLIAVFEVL